MEAAGFLSSAVNWLITVSGLRAGMCPVEDSELAAPGFRSAGFTLHHIATSITELFLCSYFIKTPYTIKKCC